MNVSTAHSAAAAGAILLKVRKGSASPQELAAITAILVARATAHPAGPAAVRDGRTMAGWRRLERTPGFRSPTSWQG
ncbi:acyl-CoA carboxylase subunit epsilon [Streptomyces sp. NBC_00247]|uniref:acyl-CoA carboxylase subunit epsilon n=1 Tax=Streptomyces sp. NBC_00247 TaxID=2975689 RepID=UPI002E2BB5DD|nr:acyl-CoA carboxylase subunit epsilon [Streptomyces sp. NBC_00247]